MGPRTGFLGYWMFTAGCLLLGFVVWLIGLHRTGIGIVGFAIVFFALRQLSVWLALRNR
jgi:hypothetical protein